MNNLLKLNNSQNNNNIKYKEYYKDIQKAIQ